MPCFKCIEMLAAGTNEQAGYRIGYQCKVVITANDVVHDIIVDIKDGPMFAATLPDQTLFTAANPQQLANKTMRHYLGKNAPRVKGSDFFGLNIKSVKDCLHPSEEPVDSVKIAMDGVVNIGVGVDDERYTYNFGGNKLRIQPGYRINRTITVNTVTEHKVSCSIKSSSSGPRFLCESANLSAEAALPTTAMKSIFELLKIPKTRNRSGYEFFGLNQSDIISQLQGDIKQKSVRKAPTACNAMINTVKRNAGPTSELKTQRAIAARNKAVHKSVQLCSFGDVASK